MEFKKSGKRLFGVFLICVMFVGMVFTTSFVTQTDPKKDTWDRIEEIRNRLIISATDGIGGSVTDGADEVVNIYIYPHQADPGTTYGSGLSEGSAYEHFDNSFTNGEELEGETPHSTTFDIVIEMQYDYDHVYDGTLNVDLVDCWCNESQLSISSQKMEHSSAFFDTDGTSDTRINFWLCDADGGAGTGFTINQLDQINDIEFKPYYRS